MYPAMTLIFHGPRVYVKEFSWFIQDISCFMENETWGSASHVERKRREYCAGVQKVKVTVTG